MGEPLTDEQIAETMREVWKKDHYLLDPHGACGFRALAEGLKPGEMSGKVFGLDQRVYRPTWRVPQKKEESEEKK